MKLILIYPLCIYEETFIYIFVIQGCIENLYNNAIIVQVNKHSSTWNAKDVTIFSVRKARDQNCSFFLIKTL